jgi:homoserine kinase
VFVRVPGSSANLGPGFDALGMALTVSADVGVIADDGTPPGPAVDEHHPATIAFRAAGGQGRLWVRSSIPVGRGLGFSGAVRVGGVLAAHHQRAPGEQPPIELLHLAAGLEDHADNVAASWFGGIVVTTGGRAIRLPCVLEPAVVVWIPPSTTSTDASRRRLDATVARADAVFNVGRTALLVAALSTGDVDALRTATQDRLHQDARLRRAEPSRVAMDGMLGAGAWCTWLSGSGPTVAAMCAPDDVPAVLAGLPADGHSKVLAIDVEGAVRVEAEGLDTLG